LAHGIDFEKETGGYELSKEVNGLLVEWELFDSKGVRTVCVLTTESEL